MTPDDAMTARAFQIADQSMIDLLLCHGIPFDRSVTEITGGAVALCDSNSVEVTTLREADPAIAEAYEWLRMRGRAELIENCRGSGYILLKGAA